MNVFKINKRITFIAYILFDTILVGLGMGVPLFCILFGFPVGWYLAKRLILSKRSSNQILREILKYGLFTCMVTFILMIIIWMPFSSMLLDPNANFRNFGIPMILYDPRMSFIGWMILMVIISPFLQLLTTIFASNVTLLRLSNSKI